MTVKTRGLYCLGIIVYSLALLVDVSVPSLYRDILSMALNGEKTALFWKELLMGILIQPVSALGYSLLCKSEIILEKDIHADILDSYITSRNKSSMLQSQITMRLLDTNVRSVEQLLSGDVMNCLVKGIFLSISSLIMIFRISKALVLISVVLLGGFICLHQLISEWLKKIQILMLNAKGKVGQYCIDILSGIDVIQMYDSNHLYQKKMVEAINNLSTSRWRYRSILGVWNRMVGNIEIGQLLFLLLFMRFNKPSSEQYVYLYGVFNIYARGVGNISSFFQYSHEPSVQVNEIIQFFNNNEENKSKENKRVTIEKSDVFVMNEKGVIFLGPEDCSIEEFEDLIWECASYNEYTNVAFVGTNNYILSTTPLLNVCEREERKNEGRVILSKMGMSHTTMNKEIIQNGKNLSGGEKKKVAIARAIIKDAAVYFFEYPFEELDQLGTNVLNDYIKQNKERKKFVIFTDYI